MLNKNPVLVSWCFIWLATCTHCVPIFSFAAEETFPAAVEVKYFQLSEWQEKFLRRQIEKLSIKITSLAKYFAGPERNDEVENGLYKPKWDGKNERLTTLTGFPAFQSFAFTLLLSHNGAAQFFARALFIFVNVWSHDCSAVRLFPDKSRPPLPVYKNSSPWS